MWQARALLFPPGIPRLPFVDEIVLVTGQDEIAYCQEHFVEQYGFSKVHAVVAGGKERYAILSMKG